THRGEHMPHCLPKPMPKNRFTAIQDPSRDPSDSDSTLSSSESATSSSEASVLRWPPRWGPERAAHEEGLGRRHLAGQRGSFHVRAASGPVRPSRVRFRAGGGLPAAVAAGPAAAVSRRARLLRVGWQGAAGCCERRCGFAPVVVRGAGRSRVRLVVPLVVVAHVCSLHAVLSLIWKGRGDARAVRRAFGDLGGSAPRRPARPILGWVHPYLYFPAFPRGSRGEGRGEDPLFHTRPIDVWLPQRCCDREGARRPILFWVHGGAWVGGHARFLPAAPLLQALAARGWLVVSCEYRRGAWPQQLEDCAEALRYTRTVLADEHGGDLDALAIGGASAGGHIASLLTLQAVEEGACPVRSSLLFYPALDPKDSGGVTLHSPLGLPRPLGLRRGQSLLAWFFERVVLRGDASRWPSAEPLARLEGASAARAARASGAPAALPRTLVVHGTHDSSVVPVEHSRQWVEALERRGGGCAEDSAERQHQLVEVPGARHTFEVAPGAAVEAAFDGALAWLEQPLDKRQRSADDSCALCCSAAA
ncbi:unnamed protein product, partial [Prorocentrum cordatum]